MSRMSNKSRIGLIAVALAGSMSLASTVFAAEAMPQGYQLASAEKTSEGKCGEGKCGAGETGEGAAPHQVDGEGAGRRAVRPVAGPGPETDLPGGEVG